MLSPGYVTQPPGEVQGRLVDVKSLCASDGAFAALTWGGQAGNPQIGCLERRVGPWLVGRGGFLLGLFTSPPNPQRPNLIVSS